jgi:hypothetical protein
VTRSDKAFIREAFDALLEPGQVVELRVLQTPQGTVSGYFTDSEKMAAAAARFNGKAPAVYFTLNPVMPELLARANNRVKGFVRTTTNDDDIRCRRWLGLDFDAVRPTGISSSDAEHEAALCRAAECRVWLTTLGWPEPVAADSGNGAHLLYRIDLPNDALTRQLLEQVLYALALQFSDKAVVVDTGVFNAARIWKVYGTRACKGDPTPERPHRTARLLSVPRVLCVVTREHLEAVAARLPQDDARRSQIVPRDRFDLEQWISEHAASLSIVRSGTWSQGRKWILNPCPWNPEHTNHAAYIVQFASGAIAAGCHHNGCEGNDWPALRAIVGDPPRAVYQEQAKDGNGAAPVSRSQATQLVDLALDAGVELWHTPTAEPHITIPVATHREHHQIGSRGIRDWLSRLHHQKTHRTLSSQALKDALSTLAGIARYDGDEHDVYVRVAGDDATVYLDLGDATWRAVEITSDTWRTVSNPAVRFRRGRSVRPLPAPISGGSLDALRELIHVEDDDWTLLIGWLVGALRPNGPYPLFAFDGEQGSSKSTTTRMLRRVIDPSAAELRAEPRDIQDLMIASTHGWCVAFDNLRYLQPWLSDGLCRLSTGGALSKRELYSDGEEYILEAMRPVLLNGIGSVVTSGDLQDRTITTTLPAIPETKRRPEAELWARYNRIWPGVLGGLLDGVSCALRRRSEVQLTSLPRMADWAVWVTAAAPDLGLEDSAILAAFEAGQQHATEDALEGSQLSAAIRTLTLPWHGFAVELHKKLIPSDPPKTWPKTPRGLSAELRRLAPLLRRVGIDVRLPKKARTARERTIHITEVGAQQDKQDPGHNDAEPTANSLHRERPVDLLSGPEQDTQQDTETIRQRQKTSEVSEVSCSAPGSAAVMLSDGRLCHFDDERF